MFELACLVNAQVFRIGAVCILSEAYPSAGSCVLFGHPAECQYQRYAWSLIYGVEPPDIRSYGLLS